MQPECLNDERIASFARVQLDLDHLKLKTFPGQPGWEAGEFDGALSGLCFKLPP